MEVIADILIAASVGQPKTRIMYGANLNFLRFEKYFSELLEQGLIAEEKDGKGARVYVVTEKGEKLLVILKNAKQIITV